MEERLKELAEKLQNEKINLRVQLKQMKYLFNKTKYKVFVTLSGKRRGRVLIHLVKYTDGSLRPINYLPHRQKLDEETTQFDSKGSALYNLDEIIYRYVCDHMDRGVTVGNSTIIDNIEDES